MSSIRKRVLGVAAAATAAAVSWISCSSGDEASGIPVAGVQPASFRFRDRRRSDVFVQSPTPIRKFVTTLPGLGPTGANSIGQYIPIATKETTKLFGQDTDVYRIAVSEFRERLHPDLPGETHLWGYADDTSDASQQYLGGVIVAQRGTPVLLSVRNNLPNRSLVPVDLSLPAGDGLRVADLPLNRIATHLHGGFTPWFSDGTPFQWFLPSGQSGASFMQVPGTRPPPGTATYYYPNQQSARLLWYHDHAMGITRTNAYSGIASAYLLTDDFETQLITLGILPDLGTPLIIQDKGFVPPRIRALDPSYRWGQPGDLWYPHVYQGSPLPDFDSYEDTSGDGRWSYGPDDSPPMTAAAAPLPQPSVVPEAFFDTPVVNGALYPVVHVPSRRVRFRILNASQARFWHLNLYAENPLSAGEPDVRSPGPAMIQIGNEGGFLPAVAIHPNGIPLTMVSDYPNPEADPSGPFNLLLGPAERADVLIDFARWAGKAIVLYNDAPAPFPGGDPRNDYFTGNLDLSAFGGAPATRIGYGPNTRTILKFVVDAAAPDEKSTREVLFELTARLTDAYRNGEQPPLLYRGRLPYKGPVHRRLSLNEDYDSYGRLVQRLGTLDARGLTSGDGLTIDGLDNQGLPTRGRAYMDAATENPTKDAVEVWEIYNFTGDTHPIHFHLVNVQVIQRVAFEADDASVDRRPRPPDANERGWKETVRMNPGEVTTVIARFSLPTLPVRMGDPLSPRTGGHEYVWHCHILEHEEHDMMRPLVVY